MQNPGFTRQIDAISLLTCAVVRELVAVGKDANDADAGGAEVGRHRGLVASARSTIRFDGSVRENRDRRR